MATDWNILLRFGNISGNAYDLKITNMEDRRFNTHERPFTSFVISVRAEPSASQLQKFFCL
jgi:hypothetical protein